MPAIRVTYLDLSFGDIERQLTDDDLAVLRGSWYWTSRRLHSRFDRFKSLLDTTDWRSTLWFVAALDALGLLLAVDNSIERLIETGRHVEIVCR